MTFDWQTFFTALGLAFILEGLPYFLFAEKLPQVLRQLSDQPPGFLRKMGITAILFGLGLIFLIRGLS